MKPCPKCGNPDELELDSEGAAEASWIECHWCEFRFQKRCDEETLVEKWDKMSRAKMPVFIDPYALPIYPPASEVVE
jgi:hypothetical protein